MATILIFQRRKGLAKSLKEQKVSPDETLGSFDVSGIFTSIPVLTVLDIINRKFTEHINQNRNENLLEHTYFIPKAKDICLVELVPNSCVFSFQGNFYQQLQRATMDSPVSPVIANIYMEYFKEASLCPECPIPTSPWKRYVDDVISTIKKNK